MKRRLALGSAAVLLFGIGAVLLNPSWRLTLLALLRGEQFYDGRPTSYWRTQLQEESFTRYGPDAVEAPVLQQGGPAVVPVLIEVLDDGNQDDNSISSVSLKASQILSQIKPAPVPQLVEALNRRAVANVRLGVVQALTKLGPEAKDAIPALMAALKDPSHRVRAEAALALGGFGPEAFAAAPALSEAVNDSHGKVRVKSARALWQVGRRAEGIRALEQLLDDADEFIATEAADDLGQIGPEARPAVPQLVKAAKKGAFYLSPAAHTAVKKIAPEVAKAEQLPPLEKSAAWKAGGPEIAALIELLKSPDERTAAEAAEGLARVAPEAKEAVPLLVKAAKKGSARLSPAARAALKKIAPEVEKAETFPEPRAQ